MVLANDPITKIAFSLYENKGVFALLLGSGLSRAADIPTGWEITLDLIRRVALAEGVAEQTDWAGWYRDKTGVEPNYSALLEELASSPEERRSILHSYIEPTDTEREEGRKLPTAAHHAIAELVRGGYIRVIVTTNFDRLMENALRERGIEPTIISSVDALAGAEPLVHSVCYVLKLHGDYKDARILNTQAELTGYPAQYDLLLDRIFDEHGLIVAGWSGEWDHALRGAFLRAPNRRYSVFWTSRGKLRAGAQDLVNHRKARLVPIVDANSFFTTLNQRVETLEKSQQQNPLSKEILINTTKRFLAKPEYRIQLDELFTQETERLLAQLDSPEFSPTGQFDQSTFRQRIQKYDALTETVASMVGVLGRWADDSELPLVIGIMRSLYAHAEMVRSGLTVFLSVRAYPAVLIFTAYGLGLTRSERWSTLHNLLEASFVREDREPKKAVEVFFLQEWKGGEKSIWNEMEGFENHKTPLSDYLMQLFGGWSKSFAGLTADFELMYERFEMLGSLAFLEPIGEVKVLAALADNGQGTWMPTGRSGWHSMNSKKLMTEFQTEQMKSSLTRSGFAGGHPTFIGAFFQNFNRITRGQRY